MVKRIITASDIQKMKGYDAKKSISANELLGMAAEFFMENDVSSTFALVPVRFVERKDSPECGYLDFLDVSKWDSLEPTPSLWDVLDGKKEGVIGYREYKVHRNRPCVFIDEPYFKPALATYQAVGGYRTERKVWKGTKWYNIYLV